MKNASAIERCFELLERMGYDFVKEARTELAGYTEIGPCGHRKADWVEAEPFLTPEEGETHEAYCKVCREIEHAVERALSQMYTPDEMQRVIDAAKDAEEELEREVAGAYEAAALECERMLNARYIVKDDVAGPLIPHDYKHPVEAIRSLDSSAARLGKKAIREEALREAAKVVAYTIDENNILALIDKPGGR